jgi:uncharacterized membrane protein YccC
VTLWTWKKENLPSLSHSVRTALAATCSVVVARVIGMPEAYWAAIATLVVMQSTLRATVKLSIERIVASALGAFVGAVEATFFRDNLIAFALAIFFLGLMSFPFRVGRPAYSYAGVTLAIVVLIPRDLAPWLAALHRFIEVSIGFIVGLGFAAIWREQDRAES